MTYNTGRRQMDLKTNPRMYLQVWQHMSIYMSMRKKTPISLSDRLAPEPEALIVAAQYLYVCEWENVPFVINCTP